MGELRDGDEVLEHRTMATAVRWRESVPGRGLSSGSVGPMSSERYEAVSIVEVEQRHRFACSCGYSSEMIVRARGHGIQQIGTVAALRNPTRVGTVSAEARTQATALANAMAEKLLPFVRCPRCKRRDRQAIARVRNGGLKVLGVLAGIGFVVPAILYLFGADDTAGFWLLCAMMFYPIILGVWLYMWIENYREADKQVTFLEAPPRS